MSFHDVGQRRSIIDRRSIAAAMARGDATAVLREALDRGRAEVVQRLALDFDLGIMELKRSFHG